MELSFSLPVFGPSIECPHCRKTIPALTLTDSYLCQRHGAFEADPLTKELVHLQSGRQWRQWQGQWFRQHTHVDGIRFEIHEELDRLHARGMRATGVTIAHRYRPLLEPYLDRNPMRSKPNGYQLYGLPVRFSEASPLVESSSIQTDTSHNNTSLNNIGINKAHLATNSLTDTTLLQESETYRWSAINFELAEEASLHQPRTSPFSYLIERRRE